MLKNKTKIIVTFLSIILLFSTSFVFAENEIQDDDAMSISIDSDDNDQIIDEESITSQQSQDDSYKSSDVYLSGEDITIDYIVDGNVFACANTVTIDSQIGGDAFIIADKIVVNEEGYIFSNLFACANSIEIKGVVYDIYSCSQSLTISGGYVYRDVKAICSDLIVNGTIGRNAFISCSNLSFNTDESSAGIIYGDLNYTSASEISIPENVVSGDVKFTQNTSNTESSATDIVSNYIVSLVKFLAFVAIVWLLCLWLAPKFLNNTNNYVGKQSLKVLGIGLLGLIIVPIACMILLFLELTSRFSLVLLALYIIAIILSKSLFTITANNYVCEKLKITKTAQTFGMLIVSGIVVYVLAKLPYIGGLISFIICILGLGILISSIIPKKQPKNIEVSKQENK